MNRIKVERKNHGKINEGNIKERKKKRKNERKLMKEYDLDENKKKNLLKLMRETSKKERKKVDEGI